MNKILENISSRRKITILFLAILALGIFLRTWHFSDWMVFNPDQARDAMMVSDVLAGNEPWPILGPEAGNTHFDLGPWFYHLEIISGKIFGGDPWKLAIPDLIFSILTIPLFYFFVRKYFSVNMSLVLTFFSSISYFMVRYSRFAFNPNSIPFFVLLFLLGVLYFMESDKQKSLWGAALIGTAIGVGMQLHILLFFILPTVAGVAFLWLLFVKKRSLFGLIGRVVLALLCIAILNISQIKYMTEHTSNTTKFKKAFTQTSGGGNFSEDLPQDLLGQAQANLNIISTLGNNEEVDFYSNIKKIMRFHSRSLPYDPKNNQVWLLTALAIGYSLGGYFLLGYFWKKETDERRKNFLGLIFVYGTVSLIAMFPIISQASLRYYIISFFLPFIFLGMWLEYLGRLKNIETRKSLIFILVAGLTFLQLQKLNAIRADFQNQRASNSNYAIWSEVENMANYISQNSDHTQSVYIAGKKDYFSRFYKPLLYTAGKVGIDIKRGDSSDKIPADAQVFFIQDSASSKKIDKETFTGRAVKNYQKFGKVTIINLKNKL